MTDPGTRGATPRLIAVTGGSGAGKTTFAGDLQAKVGTERSATLSQDNYYRDQSAHFDEDGGSINLDHPSALDLDLLAEHVAELRAGRTVSVPACDFRTHTRAVVGTPLQPRPLIVADGTLLLAHPALAALFDASVFLEVSAQLRLERRLRRDTEERGRTRDGVQRQWASQVEPMHNLYVEKSKQSATYIVSDEISREKCLGELAAFFDAPGTGQTRRDSDHG